MSEVTFYSDHEDRITARLLSQLSEATNLQNLLQAIAASSQNLEDTLQALVEERTIAGAEGEQLDQLGLIVGEARGGRDDDEYRSGIRARIAANVSRSTPEDVMATLRAATASDDVRLIEVPPLGLLLFTSGEVVPVNLYEVVRAAAPATLATLNIIQGGGEPFETCLFVVEWPYLASSIGGFLSEVNALGEWVYEGATLFEIVEE